MGWTTRRVRRPTANRRHSSPSNRAGGTDGSGRRMRGPGPGRRPLAQRNLLRFLLRRSILGSLEKGLDSKLNVARSLLSRDPAELLQHVFVLCLIFSSRWSLNNFGLKFFALSDEKVCSKGVSTRNVARSFSPPQRCCPSR